MKKRVFARCQIIISPKPDVTTPVGDLIQSLVRDLGGLHATICRKREEQNGKRVVVRDELPNGKLKINCACSVLIGEIREVVLKSGFQIDSEEGCR